MSVPFRLEALGETYDRFAFRCGDDALDRYFQTQVTQDIRRHLANCFVAVNNTLEQITGFYTIASASILTPDLPADITKKLPRYPTMPAVRIGRLAVDQKFQGRGLGAALLADVALRTLQAAPAACALVVDAKNDNAAAFYRHHRFLAFAHQPHTLFLPVATATKLILVAER